MVQRVAAHGVVALVLLMLIAAVVLPALTSAQIPEIVPKECQGDQAATACGLCQLGQLAQNVLNAGIYIAVFLSALLFAWAGWNYITAGGDSGKAGEARKVFWNVGVGLVIILGAWLIVDLIIKVLVDQSKIFGPWNKIC